MTDTKDPQEVSEELEVVMTVREKTVLPVDDFINKLSELKKKYLQKAFDRVDVSMVSKAGDSGLLISGVRKENQEEIAARLERDEVKRKNIDEHEFKEYLRLKKKFDKKKDE